MVFSKIAVVHGVLAGVMILTAGCGMAQSQGTVTVDVEDSILYPTTDSVRVEVVRFPDTTYSSVGMIHFLVDTLDKKSSGMLDDLGDQYAGVPGVLTFRGNAGRSVPFVGKISGRPSKIVIDWIYNTPYDTVSTCFGCWGGGTGWTGQPLYIDWPDSLVNEFRNRKLMRPEAGNEEIIVASLARHLYFLDFKTGKESREPLYTGNPVKGTISLDPSLNGRLYVGQAVHSGGEFGALVFDLFTHERFSFYGRDPKAWRRWGAYDSSPVAAGQFMFRPGENGTVYKIPRYSSEFVVHSTLRYKDASGCSPGIESSMSVLRNYGFLSDNHGNILCINLDNLKPVWVYDNKDDTDSTPVVLEENGNPFVYVGSELDRQGSVGMVNLAKINGLTGDEIWRLSIPCLKRHWAGKIREGGMFSTFLPGCANCDSLIFTNICFPETTPASGEFVAINRFTGRISYRVPLAFYAWSSPVAFVNESGEMFVVTGDVAGNIYLYDGYSGDLMFKERIGANFKSSPVVVGDALVVGSRGTKIFKMHVE